MRYSGDKMAVITTTHLGGPPAATRRPIPGRCRDCAAGQVLDCKGDAAPGLAIARKETRNLPLGYPEFLSEGFLGDPLFRPPSG